MNFAWQNVVVVVLVVAAAAYLVRLGWHSIARRRAGACGGCTTCPSDAPGQQVVSLGEPVESAALQHGAEQNGAAREHRG